MFKKFSYVTCFLLIMSSTGIASAEMVAHFNFNNDSATTAKDVTGRGHDGTITGNITFGPGKFGNCMIDDGTGSIALAPATGTDIQFGGNSYTITAWIKTSSTQAMAIVAKYNTANGGTHEAQDRHFGINYRSGRIGVDNGWVGSLNGSTRIADGTWHHVAFTQAQSGAGAAGTWTLYVDGQTNGTSTQSPQADPATHQIFIGSGCPGSYYPNKWNGSIDDVRIYNNALSQDEINAIMLAGDSKGPAKSPKPDGSEISIDIGAISWEPGEFANTHNVFISTNFDDVNESEVGNVLGTTVSYPGLALDQNSIPLSRLEYNTTYYWRVDEVNAPPTSSTVFTGFIWDFTTELRGYTLPASSIIDAIATGTPVFEGEQEPNDTCKGTASGLSANGSHSNNYVNNMWLAEGDPGETWIQYEFDKVYMLYNMLVWNYNQESPYCDLFGAQDVNVSYSLDANDPNGWTTLPTVTLNPAPGTSDYNTPDTVLMEGAVAKYVRITFLSSLSGESMYGISEVRFSSEPTYATQTSPANNATGQAYNVALVWKAGRYVDEHYLYLSTDVNSVNGVGTLVAPVKPTDTSYASGLDLGKKYYWRVDEVNMANAYTTWAGTVRNLTIANTRLAEGFETHYQDNDANAVWATWGGYDVSGNGGSMGYPGTGPYLSTSNHSGGHSSPMYYDNTGSLNGATDSWVKANTADLPTLIGTDWSVGNPTSLVIWFMGDPNNVPQQLYVKLNNTKVVYDGNPVYMTQSIWRPFVIDLSQFGGSLSNITSITIGMQKIGTQAGSGRIFLDDISLYGVAPEGQAAPVAPSNTGLIAYYKFENDVKDNSGNGHNGTIVGTPTYVPGVTGYGMAMQFNGTTDCIDLGVSDPNQGFNPPGSFSVSLWAKIQAWSTNWCHVMIGNRGEDNLGWQLRRYSNNRFCFTTRTVGDDDTYSNANPPPINEWVHITCVYDSVAHTKSIYLDGFLDRSVTLTNTNTKIAATTLKTYIGARSTSDNSGPDTTTFFTGMLDEIRLYNRALSAGEAAYLANPAP
jgi:hypothetical protein